MDEVTHYFSVEGSGTTVVHPLGLAMLLMCGTLLIVLPRRYALWPFLVLVCFVSARQCVAIANLNLYLARIMILVFAPLRLLLHPDRKLPTFNRIDGLMIAFGLTYIIAGAINFGFNPAEIKTRSGYIVESLGIYFTVRVLIREQADVQSFITAIAIVALSLLPFFLIEAGTGHNIFSIFGGVPAITVMREGRLRCQGAFGHPILAGVFWCSLLPLLIYGVVAQRRGRWLMILGSLAATALILLTASSTPLLGLVVALVAMAAYSLRRFTPLFLKALVVLLVFLHLIMKAPVWSLIARIDLTRGNSGYHRYLLVNGLITHFHEWWLLGTRQGTEHWGHFAFDTANHFVVVGAGAGVFVLALFIAIIVTALRATARLERTSPLSAWSIAFVIVVHCVCFFGISVWGQLQFSWSLCLGLAASLGLSPVKVAGARVTRAKAWGPRAPHLAKVGLVRAS